MEAPIPITDFDSQIASPEATLWSTQSCPELGVVAQYNRQPPHFFSNTPIQELATRSAFLSSSSRHRHFDIAPHRICRLVGGLSLTNNFLTSLNSPVSKTVSLAAMSLIALRSSWPSGLHACMHPCSTLLVRQIATVLDFSRMSLKNVYLVLGEAAHPCLLSYLLFYLLFKSSLVRPSPSLPSIS